MVVHILGGVQVPGLGFHSTRDVWALRSPVWPVLEVGVFFLR